MANLKLARCLVAFLIVSLLLSLMTIGVFAGGDESEVESSAESEVESSAESEVESSVESQTESAADTTGAESSADTTGTESSAEPTTTEESGKKGLSKNTIVGLVIAGVLVVGIIVLVCVLALSPVKREKFFKVLRGFKSEFKKIVWYPFTQLRKSTLVVLIVVVVCAVILALLDFGFSKGILSLGNIFKKG